VWHDPDMLRCLPLILLLAACSADPPAVPDVVQTRVQHAVPTFAFAQSVEPRTLDPGIITDTHSGYLARNMFEGLLSWDAAAAEPVAAAAESWSVSDDGLTWTFQLRQDAVWSNGDPVTANDFVLSWRRVLDPGFGSDYAALLYPIRGAKALNRGEVQDPETLGVGSLDRHTLVVHLDRPTPWFAAIVAHNVLAPVNGEVVKRHGWDWTRPGKIVVNGPFVLTEWTSEGLVLSKNLRYHSAADVQLSRVVSYIVPDPDRVLEMYEEGKLQWTGHSSAMLPLDRLDELASRPDAHHHARLGTAWYALNTADDALSDPRVRRALMLALDRSELATILGPSGVAAAGLVPPGIPGYTSPAGSEYDPDAARKLLAQAGYTDAEPFPPLEIAVDARAMHQRAAEWMAASWRKTLGVQAGVYSREWKVHAEAVSDGAYQVGRGGWVADFPDPVTFLDLFESTNPLNTAGFADPTYDAMIAEAAATTDSASRMRLLSQAERVLIDKSPILPLFHFASFSLLKPYVGGYEDNALNLHLLRYVSLGTTGGPGMSRGD
jgi:oligopeptide transport system substrate-binding protein